MALSRHHRRLLEEFAYLPPNALVPLPVAAVVEGVSTKTIRRNHQLEAISECRKGVRKKNLRAAGEAVTA